jgi:hypothetical protein
MAGLIGRLQPALHLSLTMMNLLIKQTFDSSQAQAGG